MGRMGVAVVMWLVCFWLVIPVSVATSGEVDVGGGVAPTNEVGVGLPVVSSEEFVAKVTRMVGAIYKDVVQIAPQITLLVCLVGLVLGIFSQAARISVLWSIGALLLILWAPQIVGLVKHYTNQ